MNISKKKLKLKKKITNNTKKLTKSKKKKEYTIRFNPLDKFEDLPTINLTIKNKSKIFLLGHKSDDSFYNIYENDNTLNNLVGKVRFTSSDKCTVILC